MVKSALYAAVGLLFVAALAYSQGKLNAIVVNCKCHEKI